MSSKPTLVRLCLIGATCNLQLACLHRCPLPRKRLAIGRKGHSRERERERGETAACERRSRLSNLPSFAPPHPDLLPRRNSQPVVNDHRGRRSQRDQESKGITTRPPATCALSLAPCNLQLACLQRCPLPRRTIGNRQETSFEGEGEGRNGGLRTEVASIESALFAPPHPDLLPRRNSQPVVNDLRGRRSQRDQESKGITTRPPATCALSLAPCNLQLACLQRCPLPRRTIGNRPETSFEGEGKGEGRNGGLRTEVASIESALFAPPHPDLLPRTPLSSWLDDLRGEKEPARPGIKGHNDPTACNLRLVTCAL